MLFYFIDKLMGFHLRGQPTFQDKNFGSYTDFPKALKMPIFDDVNEKSDDFIKKNPKLIYNFLLPFRYTT